MSQSEKKGANEKKLHIQLSEEIAGGMYSNLVIVNHNETEFVLDFAYVQPQGPQAKVRSRIQLHPKQAKRLLAVLQQRVKAYEAAHGEIRGAAPDGPSSVH